MTLKTVPITGHTEELVRVLPYLNMVLLDVEGKANRSFLFSFRPPVIRMQRFLHNCQQHFTRIYRKTNSVTENDSVITEQRSRMYF